MSLSSRANRMTTEQRDSSLIASQRMLANCLREPLKKRVLLGEAVSTHEYSADELVELKRKTMEDLVEEFEAAIKTLGSVTKRLKSRLRDGVQGRLNRVAKKLGTFSNVQYEGAMFPIFSDIKNAERFYDFCLLYDVDAKPPVEAESFLEPKRKGFGVDTKFFLLSLAMEASDC